VPFLSLPYWAIGLLANGTDVPRFDKVTITFGTGQILVTETWTASADDPDNATVVVEVDPQETFTPNTHLIASVSMNDGTNYETVTLSSDPLRTVGTHEYYLGTKTGLTARTANDMRVKLQLTKNIHVHAISTSLKWTE